MVGWGSNLRKPIFQNEKLREALNYAFDFEELNRTLFYGQYERIDSYFFGLDRFARPACRRARSSRSSSRSSDLVPAEVFTTEYKNPVGGDPTKLRANLRTALQLLERGRLHPRRQPAGRRQRPAARVRDPAQRPDHEPQSRPVQKNLQAIGIDATIRTVDSPQYIERMRDFDFDMVYSAWAQSMSTRATSSATTGARTSASEEGSQNYLGIADPGIDALIDKIIFADDRDDALRRDRARSTACCWPTTTSCRATRSATRASPAGTASATPSRCPNSRRASRRSGGGTRPRPQRPAGNVRAVGRGPSTLPRVG